MKLVKWVEEYRQGKVVRLRNHLHMARCRGAREGPGGSMHCVSRWDVGTSILSKGVGIATCFGLALVRLAAKLRGAGIAGYSDSALPVTEVFESGAMGCAFYSMLWGVGMSNC